MTIAVDLGRKATKQTKNKNISPHADMWMSQVDIVYDMDTASSLSEF